MSLMRLSVLCSTFVVISTAVYGQGFDRTDFISTRVEAIRIHFENVSDFNLAAAQRLLIATGADLDADGVWGPATESAFAATIDTMSRIGITSLQSTDPYSVTRSVVTWQTALIEAQIGVGDYPD
jgi:hypothetical protein